MSHIDLISAQPAIPPVDHFERSRDVHPDIAFLAFLMDDCIPIPGTKYRIGLDGLIGLIPVLGDLLTLFIARLLMKEADRLGVSRWTKVRMYGNYAIDTVVGMIPLFGDAFDFAFKAHRRNLRLLERHIGRHRGDSEALASPRYRYNWPSAIVSALAASIAITLYMLTIPRWLGMEDMDIGLIIASLAAPDGGPMAIASRLAWHVGNGVVYVFLYAAVLCYWQKPSKIGTGALFGILLWLLGPMLLIPSLLAWWGVPADCTNPGIFMLDLGLGWAPAMTDLGAHIVHGIIAGALYKHRVAFAPRHRE